MRKQFAGRPNYTGNEPCGEVDPEFFYKELIVKSLKKTLKGICASCDIQNECAEYAIHTEPWGFWGGLTPIERRQIRKQRNITIDHYFAA
jgi:hypothetical protein